MPSVTPMPHAQAIESWSPIAPSALVATWATTPVPDTIKTMAPRRTAHATRTATRKIGFGDKYGQPPHGTGQGLRTLGRAAWAPPALRAHAMNAYASPASGTGLAVKLGAVGAGPVTLVHHVFRP